MGIGNVDEIGAQFVAHGSRASMPAALIEQGTQSEQRVISGDLATLPPIAAGLKPLPPALLIVGDVVSLHSSLHWFGAVDRKERSRRDLPVISVQAGLDAAR